MEIRLLKHIASLTVFLLSASCGDISQNSYAKEVPQTITADFGKGLEITIDAPKANERLALIITNQNYVDDKLNNIRNAINDGDKIEALFGGENGLGYDVTRLTDQNLQDLVEGVEVFSEKITPDSTVMVYYSGHGVALDGENLLVPADFDDKVTSSSKNFIKNRINNRTVNLRKQVLEVIDRKSPSGLVVFYDACRNDILSSLKRNIGSSSFVPSRIEGSAIFYSAAAGQFAIDRLSDEDPVELSLFTRVLVDTLQDNPTIKLRDLHPSLTSGVDLLADSIGQTQKPTMKNDLEYNANRSDFCLVTANGKCGAVQTQPNSNPKGGADIFTRMRNDWNTIETSADIEEFEIFINEYKNIENSKI